MLSAVLKLLFPGPGARPTLGATPKWACRGRWLRIGECLWRMVKHWIIICHTSSYYVIILIRWLSISGHHPFGYSLGMPPARSSVDFCGMALDKARLAALKIEMGTKIRSLTIQGFFDDGCSHDRAKRSESENQESPADTFIWILGTGVLKLDEARWYMVKFNGRWTVPAQSPLRSSKTEARWANSFGCMQQREKETINSLKINMFNLSPSPGHFAGSSAGSDYRMCFSSDGSSAACKKSNDRTMSSRQIHKEFAEARSTSCTTSDNFGAWQYMPWV